MRGCQRQIIMLKGTDSQIFDEAYFLLRKDFDRSRGSMETTLAHLFPEMTANITAPVLTLAYLFVLD